MAWLLWKSGEEGPGNAVPLVLYQHYAQNEASGQSWLFCHHSLSGYGAGGERLLVCVSPSLSHRQAVWAENILHRRLPGADLQGDGCIR